MPSRQYETGMAETLIEREVLLPIDKSILIISDPGGGKTRFIGTCPRPILLLDFDKGFATLEDNLTDIDVHVLKDAPIGVKARPERGLYPYGEAWDRFHDVIHSADESRYRTYAIDSFTTMQASAMAHVLKNAGHKQPTQQDYGSLLNMQKALFDELVTWPGVKIVTAHIERSKNALTEEVEKLPLGLGAFPSLLPSYMDEIYYIDFTRPRQAGGESKRMLVTEPSSFIRQARTRRNVPNGSEVSFQTIEPYLRPRQ